MRRMLSAGDTPKAPTGIPAEVHITIERRGWNLTNVEPGRLYNVYPDQSKAMSSNWSIGPIEVARILERLGIRVNITVERSV